MASDFDPADFVDSDFRSSPKFGATASTEAHSRPPTREESDAKVHQMRSRLAELKQEQERLEREKANLEELRRKQMEYATGRQEMMEHLTRGTGLLEEAAFDARREAEQMEKALQGLKEAQAKVALLDESQWAPENYQVELTRALTTLENARMEWNTARLKFPLLNNAPAPSVDGSGPEPVLQGTLQELTFPQLCRLGVALTWPICAAVIVLGVLLWLRG